MVREEDELMILYEQMILYGMRHYELHDCQAERAKISLRLIHHPRQIVISYRLA